MRMANRHGQCIRCVVWGWYPIESEQQLDHLLNLTLVRATVPNDGTFDLCRRVFQHFAAGLDRRKNGDTSRVSELQRAARVARVEQILDDHAGGAAL
jgi:hypothetical protein